MRPGMLKRLRQLNISLAAKCQLLFGAAVVLIIGAALYVPWQRMEQLMRQMNQRTALTLADWAETDHVARAVMARPPATAPATQPADAVPSTAPSGASSVAAGPIQAPVGRGGATVQLILIRRDPRTLPRGGFEARALEYFQRHPDATVYPRKPDTKIGAASFRLARPLYASPACMSCHAQDLPPVPATAPAATMPATQPASAAGRDPLLGLVSVEIPYQVDVNQVYLNRIFIFVAGLVAGTLAFIVFYLITTRLILGPVRVLQEAAEKVSKGDLNIRSDISTGDEFQTLSETFNRMLTNLQKGEEQLRAINKSLDLKLGQLAESNLALYESNRLKSEFLANVSHELRTPLNSILGFAELLKDMAVNDAKSARYVQNIITSGRNLLDLINDLLDLAKIEAGRMEVRSEPLSLSDLLEGLIGIIKPLAERKGISIVTSVGRDLPILQTDPAKLQQILYNFLSNAIKFSPQSGRIEINAQRDGEDWARISVSDQGPGIPPDKQQLIFEKFRQLDGSATREHGGTGLGLAISRELITLLGGSIGVQSTPGQGATFWVRLPLRIQAGTQPLHVMVQNH